METLLRKASSVEKYEQYRPQMKNGDVIAFSGKGLLSDIIKLGTLSPYSHVGILLNVDMSGGLGQSVLMIESTAQIDLRDADNKEVQKGVQIHWLSKRLEMYDGKVWWVPLKQEIPQEGLIKMEMWLRKTHNQKVGFDEDQMWWAGIDLFDRFGLENEPDFSLFFCSEFVTKALQEAGVIDPEINPSEQTPKDVVNFPIFQQPLLLK
ncbi:MAG: hypothetical protein QNJ37_15135 [Crocosphaera sp.]|nr:hypothetical protein [Crocosphaera sp.]